MILVAAGIATFGAAIIQRITGLGFVLALIGPIVLLYGGLEGVTLAVQLALVSALAALPFVWRDVWWRRAWTLIWPGLIAAPFGAVLVWSLPEPALLLLVGLLAIATLLLGRVPSLLAGLSGACGARIAGATSGMLHVTSGLSGPPLAAYAVNDRWEQRSFVASVQVVFVAFALATIGLRPMPVTPIGDIAILSAATVLGIAAGTWLTRFIPVSIARRAMLTVAWLGAGVVLTRGLLALTVG